MKKKHIYCGIECLCESAIDPWIIMKGSGIDFTNKFFYVDDALVFTADKRSAFPKTFHVDFFQNMIDSCCCAERLVVHLYQEGVIPQKIEDYSQYLDSLCEMVLLICDGFYFEAYAKDADWLEALSSSARKIPVIELTHKFEDEDTRIGFYV